MNAETSSLSSDQLNAALDVFVRAGAPMRLIEPLKMWIELRDDSAPLKATDLDLKWGMTPDELPGDHFVAFASTLSSSSLVGCQYVLSSSQRDVLRERYGMTPTEFIEVTNKTRDPSSGAVTSISLRSCLHVDQRYRTSVLIACRISAWGAFCEQVARLDAAKADANLASDVNPRAPRKPRTSTLSQADLLAMY